ncbi:hypothetical protein LLE49_21055 [Alicyclobacillus tolerans]|uniref:hypothetical protein n=1 Tax=Alicyclobacillus tolerans TaxID=90970 RepID=UPI001F2D72A3|nr:hypothetical protein [Alicyclobacillus tolerans]MCF8567213.1 hypothetical protein [Alicyclobacillus tolerans]
MNVLKTAARLVRESSTRLDHYIVDFLLSHANLLLALVVLGLGIWGIFLQHIVFIVALMVIGALSYFFGISVALLTGLFLSVVRLIHPYLPTSVTVVIVELVGYGTIAWLGYRHKEQKRQQKESASSHADHVMPWTVANEMRTSLAAVRYLLFPLHDEATSQNLETVTKELSRIEDMFNKIEASQEKNNRNGKSNKASIKSSNKTTN